MLRNRRLIFASRTLLAVASAAAAVGLVVAHVAGGPSAFAATDDLVLTGPQRDGSPHVRSFGPAGAGSDVSFMAAGTPTSGASVAVGDVTGDGVADLVTGAGPGTPAIVQIWSRDGKTLVASFDAFPNFQGGVNVATAAIDGGAGNEIIVGAGAGGGPQVRVMKLAGTAVSPLSSFYAYDGAFRGGVYVAAAPGLVVTGAGAGGGPHVKVYGVSTAGAPTTQAEWQAFGGTFPGGARVAVGEVDGDSGLEVVAAAGPGGGPRVTVYNADGVLTGPDFMAYPAGFGGGVWVATAANVRNPGDRIITGAGAGGTPHARIWSVTGTGITEIAGFHAYAAAFAGGVRVAGFPAGSTGTTTTSGAGGSTTTTAAGATTTTTAGGSTTTTAAGNTTTTVCNGTVVGGVCVPTPTTTRAPTTTTSTTAPG